MPDVTPIRRCGSFKRLPAGLLGALALIVLFELTVASRDRHATDAALCWRETARAARDDAPGCDLLLFGDSLVKFGVLPRVLEAGGAPRAYNLALHAGPIPASYFLLRRALDAGARPRAVVLDAMTHQLSADPNDPTLARGWTEMASPRDLADLAWSLRDPDFFTRGLLGQMVPAIQARHELRAGFLARLEGRSWSLSHWFRILRRNWDINRGAQPHVPATAPVFVDPNHGGLFPDQWQPTPLNVAYFRRFCRLAADHGATVYWLIPPLHPDAQARRAARHLDDAYNAFVRAELERNPNLIVLDARPNSNAYGERVFRDAVHLDRHGALALSHSLARALTSADDDATRWRRLPAVSGGLAPELVEDMEQSRVAARSGRRRGTERR